MMECRGMRDGTLELVIRVLVADDTRLHTTLLADALKRDGAFEVMGSDSEELISRAHLNIDVLLLSSDLDEQTGRGFEVLRQVRALRPDVRAVVLLDSSKHEWVLEAFRAGARGVLSRQESVETLSKCIRSVHQGQIWANSQQLGLLVQALVSSRGVPAINAQAIEQLSKREMEIVDSVALGLSNRKIAERLGLSQHTVKNYLFKVFEKLGVSSRVELLSMAISHGAQLKSAESCLEKSYPDYGGLNDSTLAGWRRAAEQGVPIAQLELARFYWSRRANHKDLTLAYKWYSIVSQQISRTSKSVVSAMTMEQRLEAEEMAAEWLKRAAKSQPTLTGDQLIVTTGTRKAVQSATDLPGRPVTRRIGN
jgi:two-component system, NarL family, nitrate/nitrite response regulator NarL